MNHRIIRFFPAILWFLFTFYLLTLPGSRLPKYHWFDQIHGDKFVHIGMFATLVVLFFLPFKSQWQFSSFFKPALVVAFAALMYGIAMEFVQQNFIANRSFELSDIAADGIGSFLPILIYLLFYKRKPAAA